MKANNSPWAEDVRTGELYMKQRLTGISMVRLLIEKAETVTFDPYPDLYVLVKDVLRIYEKEYSNAPDGAYRDEIGDIIGKIRAGFEEFHRIHRAESASN